MRSALLVRVHMIHFLYAHLRAHHVRHAHAGWPAPYTGMIAPALFALIVMGYMIWLLAGA